jgi:hypothetical protein
VTRAELVAWLRARADLLERAEAFYDDADLAAEAAEDVEVFREAAGLLERDGRHGADG